MNSAADLHRAVQAALASKRLGTLVFVRYLFHSQAKAVPARLTQAVMKVRDWFGQPLERVYALGSVKERHITLTLEFRGSATAQVSWAGTTAAGPGIDLMVVGNHGTLYHDVGSANTWDAPDAVAAEPPADKDLQALIERALRSGRPENAEGGNP
jgi:hypothetical protein